MNDKEPIILSLGGSLIHPKEGINTEFLSHFNHLIRSQVKKGRRFFIICGGGDICRVYQKAARSVVGKIPDEDIDWLGIHATKLNAQLLRNMFHDITIPQIIFKYDKLPQNINKPVVICAGWKPGWSTDYCSALLAKDYKATNIINLSNIDLVYDKDPRKYPNAKAIEKINWQDFEKLVGSKWAPGANLPFDPIATKLAKALSLSVYIVKGSDINNLERLLSGKPFKGTIVFPSKLGSKFYNQDYYEFGIGYRGYTTTLYGRLRGHLVNIYRALKVKIFLNPETFLDVGCGPGLLIFYLRLLGIKAFGVEVSAYALSRASKRVRKYLSYGDILNIPYEDNKFEIVISADVLEHLKGKDITKALAECDRVCTRLSAHKIYTKENKWIEVFSKNDVSNISVFHKSWWRQLFKKQGYREAKIRYLILPSFIETIFLLEKRKKTIKGQK